MTRAMDHDRPELRARVRHELLYPTRSEPMVAETRLTFEDFRAALEAVRQPAETPRSLWDAGQSLGEIAERLGMTIGEVAQAISEAA